MQAALEQNLIAESILDRTEHEFEQKVGLTAKLFGCWHKEMSRPFTHGRQSYRVCLDCGARRHFDPESFRTYGPYFYPPAVLKTLPGIIEGH